MAEGEDRSLVALEHDLNQMGLSVEDLEPPEDGHFDRQAMVRVESARVMSQRFIERDRVKDRIIAQTKVWHRETAQVREVVRLSGDSRGTNKAKKDRWLPGTQPMMFFACWKHRRLTTPST